MSNETPRRRRSLLDQIAPEADFVPFRWGESDRFVPRTFVRPLQQFSQQSIASGVFMLIAAATALIWANSPWYESYEALWDTHAEFALGDLVHLDHLTLRDWVNDGLMAIFFFVMALEIKRELISGHLRDRRAAAVPALAALGGMVVPALMFVAVTSGNDGSGGWGIPMATDIAFAVGCVALLGDRVPAAARVFLLSLAIVDDIGAIMVIAIFYTAPEKLKISWLLVAMASLVVIVILQRLHLRTHAVLLPLGVFVWFAVHESGVHATIAGVALGLLTPAWSFFDPRKFGRLARPLVDQIQENITDDGGLTHEESEENDAMMIELIRLSNESMSPLQRHLFRLEPWITSAIVPIFAFANAGVRFVDDMSNPFADSVTTGVIVGLVVGKTVGVFGAAWLAVKSGIGPIPEGSNWGQILGISTIAGIGFTVALFVANLAYPESQQLIDSAKIGILLGSLLAGVIGFLVLRSSTSEPEPVDASAS